jgi:hypothetical protein
MAKALKVRAGYVAPLPENTSFRIDGKKPSGLYINGGLGLRVFLQYAGIDHPAMFDLPQDTEVLRSLASAIRQFADDPEHFPHVPP